MTALDIIEAAAECIGVPFRHQGRSIEPGPGQGIDCVGLAVHVARSLGLEYIDRTGYSRSPNGTDLQDTLDAQPCLLPIKRSDVQPGDLLLMRFGGPAACRDLRRPDHHPRLRAARLVL